MCREVPDPGRARSSASVGFALFEEATTADEVLSRADDAMYADKARGTRTVRHLRSVE